MASSIRIHCVALCLILFINYYDCFYVPGVAPTDFEHGDPVEIKAVKLTSVKAQLPYEYYSLAFCKPPSEIKYKAENLGEVLRGDRIVNTPYVVNMTVPEKCSVLCDNVKLSEKERKTLQKRIRQEYFVHLLADNLPCATKFRLLETGETQYEHGYRLGAVKDNKVYINNHVKFIMLYHSVEATSGKDERFRIVGFEVETRSIDKNEIEKSGNECKFKNTKVNAQEITDTGNNNIMFTYEVVWVKSKVRWASRWDIYLRMTDVQIHWFSIINSVVVVLFLAGILTMIIIRTLRKDIAKYNRPEDELDDTLEETGWKLVHGDVFRPPQKVKLFTSFIGSGMQILCCSFLTIVFAMLGMLSPSSRGSLMQWAIILFMLMGLIAGFFSGRLYKTLKGDSWKKAALQTATLYPTIVFGCCFFLNFFIWGKQSSGAVPFTTMILLFFMWFGISLPLVYLGYYFGYRKQPYSHPVRTNQIPRQVPDQQWYLNPVFGILIAGILPFGAMFIELFFIFTAIWENQFYYLFGFLFLVFVILIISCSQISIVMVYFQLCGEDYRWWWRSFIVSGGSAFYVFAYSIFYFVTKLEISEFIPTLLYFGYTLLMVFTFWLMTGTIGFYAAYTFIRKIYSEIHIE